jgi:hypothetical protein
MSEANVPPRNERSGYSAPDSSGDSAASGQTWTPVPLPGSLPLDDMPSAAAQGSPRESELLTLIRDLNRCNEALMARVNQLEGALDKSQSALQAEVERSRQRRMPSPQEEQATAAQQRSTAQLLQELETANDALKRQRILTETLQAQLDTSQERVGQLDRECTLLRQRQGEQGQALQKADALCRDLRSRLQRQQRYTLQFKAALEKCLDMNAQGSTAPVPSSVVLEAPYSSAPEPGSNPLSMPRAERIQPWSAGESLGTTADLDPQLRALLHRPHSPEGDADAFPRQGEQGLAAPVTHEADTRLWQDLERVIDHADTAEAAISPEAATDATTDTTVADGGAVFTEPSPWGPPQPRTVDAADGAPPSVTDSAATEVPAMTAADDGHVIPPWQRDVDPLDATDSPGSPVGEVADLPVFNLTGSQGGSPSPLVHPLRPQKKKRTSLSAVELPSFPPLPRTSNS